MSQIFNLPNFADENLKDVTTLTQDAASGQDTINVEGVNGMSADDFGLVGALGGLASQLLQILSITGLAVKFTANLKGDHLQTEQFTTLFGDQIRAYRVAADPSGYPPLDADFLANVLSTFSIDDDSPVTQFIDNSGGEGFWYKFVYYNSDLDLASPIQNALLIRGGNSRNYSTTEDVRREAGLLTNQQLADTQVDFRRLQGDSEIDGVLLASGYTLPLKDGRGELYVPPLINNIARLLSAGYVLIQDYGPIAEGNSKDGEDKLKVAKQLLQDLQERKKVLVDLAGNLMSTKLRVKGWPDDTTAFAGSGDASRTPEPPMFTMSKKF